MTDRPSDRALAYAREAIMQLARDGTQKIINAGVECDPAEATFVPILAKLDALAATPEGAQAELYGWVMTGPYGTSFIPSTHKHVMKAVAKTGLITAVEVYTHHARDAEDAARLDWLERSRSSIQRNCGDDHWIVICHLSKYRDPSLRAAMDKAIADGASGRGL